MVRRLAFKIQHDAFQKKHPDIAQSQQERITKLIEQCEAVKKKEYATITEKILTRTFKGTEYQVVQRLDGKFEFKGQLYDSLSPIAREITGTNWSGPAFFGLKKK